MNCKELIEEYRTNDIVTYGSKLIGGFLGLTGAALGAKAAMLSQSGDMRDALFNVGAATAYTLVAIVLNEIGKHSQNELCSLDSQIQTLSSSEL